MNKILKRDDFISEVYTPMMEEKEYEELVSINEGLLKNLFGMVKNMFRGDWNTIKGEPEIIKVYKEIDDSLSGFTIMKLSKKDVCNKVRQVLVDFACDWYDLKMNKAKESGNDPTPARSMNFKNETLRENLAECEKKIKDIIGEDEQMKKWSNTLMSEMKTVINRSILDDIKDEETKKEVQEDIDNSAKKRDEVNKEMVKWQKGQLEQIQKERETLITSFDATPEKGDTSGDKEVSKLYALFKDDDKNKFIEAASNDNLLGFNSIFKKSNGSKGIDIGDKSYTMLNGIYKQMNNDIDMFKETPTQSVQAMCIAINNFVKLCNSKNMTVKPLQLELMAKCAICSDGTISYNLPLNGKEGDDAGNYFTDIVKNIIGDKIKSSKNETIEVTQNFKDNAKKLSKQIIDKAEELKKEADEKYNKELKSLKSNKEEKES